MSDTLLILLIIKLLITQRVSGSSPEGGASIRFEVVYDFKPFSIYRHPDLNRENDVVMRKELKKDFGKRLTFVGTFERFGQKNGYKGPVETLLLVHVNDKESGKSISDHLWFNKTKGFTGLSLIKGDMVEFDARVADYEKGYYLERTTTDYKLSHPTKLKKLPRAESR